MVTLVRTNSDNSDFRKLVQLLDEYLAIMDAEEHAFYAQLNKVDSIRNVVLAYQNEELMGCGAFKEFDELSVEIKRMFVIPEHRHQGIAANILLELEKWAAELNYAFTVLETGKRQPDAIRLYQKAGYHITASYGKYANVENSVCMKKEL